MSDLDFNILQTPRSFLDHDSEFDDEMDHKKDTDRYVEDNEQTVTTIERVTYVKKP